MSTGDINLDILLDQIQEDAIASTNEAVQELRKRYPALSEKEALEIHALVRGAMIHDQDKASLVVTAPPSFAMRTRTTKIAVQEMLTSAKSSILLTGYSLSGYFSDLVDCIITKSQSGVFVKFFVNNIENQTGFDKLLRYKGKFLKIYDYRNTEDKMAALHAKVISVDQKETLITSANLSYHGQEGNIELGTRIVSQEIAKQVEDVFTRLLFSKIFREV
jgi:hypothetical protein